MSECGLTAGIQQTQYNVNERGGRTRYVDGDLKVVQLVGGRSKSMS